MESVLDSIRKSCATKKQLISKLKKLIDIREKAQKDLEFLKQSSSKPASRFVNCSKEIHASDYTKKDDLFKDQLF